MRLTSKTRVEVRPDRWETGRFSVFISDPPYNLSLNVPCTFATEDAARRVADAIEGEARDRDLKKDL